MARLGQIKQKTLDNGHVVTLHRRKSPIKGERFEYAVKVDGRVVEEDAGGTLEAGLAQFRATVETWSGDEAAGSRAGGVLSGGGLFGGGF